MATERIFHVSETAGIRRFEPRPALEDRPVGGSVVWAIGERLLANYLLPRDCPRVTFYAAPDSSPDDIRRYLGGARHVVTIDSAWAERVREGEVVIYEFDPAPFVEVDRIAAYYSTAEAVAPIAERVQADLPGAIGARGSELRVLPSLWELHDAVARSTLAFSMIRMRNASR